VSDDPCLCCGEEVIGTTFVERFRFLGTLKWPSEWCDFLRGKAADI
jgi:hypothetical protein